MALDLLYAKQVEESQIPVLRFYGWLPYCLSLGYHQRTKDINIENLNQGGFDLVRRPTGGSAIFHSEELTYSIIIPKSHFSHHNLYEMFHYNIAMALNNLGFNVSLSSDANPGSYLNQGKDTFACFNRAAKSEIKFNNKKVVGSAQKILHNSILQHGSIMTGRSHEKIIDFLNTGSEEKINQVKYLRDHSISLDEIKKNKISIVKMADMILDCLTNSQKIRNIFFKYTEDNELKLAQSLYDNLSIIRNSV